MTAPSPSILVTVFETVLGHVGLAWNARGLVRLVLPARDAETARRRVAARLTDATALEEDALAERAPAIAELVGLIRRYAEGEAMDFSDVAVDLDGMDPFRLAIYRAARGLGHGETTTYGALAAKAGFPGAARETGGVLGQNPVPLVVPCHRVLAAGGKIGGFSAPGGAASKQRMLAHENARPPRVEQAQTSLPF